MCINKCVFKLVVFGINCINLNVGIGEIVLGLKFDLVLMMVMIMDIGMLYCLVYVFILLKYWLNNFFW